jgi:hypothetical protein
MLTADDGVGMSLKRLRQYLPDYMYPVYLLLFKDTVRTVS